MPEAATLMDTGGLLLLCLMAFANTGIAVCFFLPVDGFMFSTGVLIATGGFDHHAATVCLLLSLATIAGNGTGYWLGYKAGPLLYQRKDSRFFKVQHLESARRFFDRHGALALLAGPFFPLIRTFMPIVAGMIRMDWKRLVLFGSIGSAAYVSSFVMAGYLIGSVPALQPYLKYLVGAIILVVTVPVVIRILRGMNARH